MEDYVIGSGRGGHSIRGMHFKVDFLIGNGRGGQSIRGMQLKVESIDQPKILPSYSFYHPWAETVVCRTEVVEIGGVLERKTVAGLFTILWSLYFQFSFRIGQRNIPF